MSEKTVKQLMNEIGWKRDVVMTAQKQLIQAETAHREAQWKLDEAIQALANLAETLLLRSAGETESLTNG